MSFRRDVESIYITIRYSPENGCRFGQLVTYHDTGEEDATFQLLIASLRQYDDNIMMRICLAIAIDEAAFFRTRL